MDLDRLAEKYATDLLVCLLEDHELEWLQIPDLIGKAKSHGFDTHRLPIPDGGVLPEGEGVKKAVDLILASAREGKNVVVHCAGGLGRTGTVAGCALVTLGFSSQEAIDILHRVRGPRCPENRRQERFMAEYLGGLE